MPNPELADLLRARRCAADGSGRQLREAARLSLRDIARAADLNPSTVYRWEIGARRPIGAGAIRYGRLLGDLEQLQQVAS